MHIFFKIFFCTFFFLDIFCKLDEEQVHRRCEIMQIIIEIFFKFQYHFSLFLQL